MIGRDMTQSLIHSAGLVTSGPRPVDALDVFGGRQPEGESLLGAHARLHQDGGGVVLLTGPRGVGKAQLLGGLRQSVIRSGKGPVFSGSAMGQHRPYGPVADAVREALTHLDGMGVGGEVRNRHQSALAVLDPSQLARPDAAFMAPSRLAFQDATLALLRDIGLRTTVTFILSELEESDEDTRALCRYAALHLCTDGNKGGCILVLSLVDDRGDDATTTCLLYTSPSPRD